MNKSKKIALAAAALCASFSAMAQDPVINPSWYIQPSINGVKPDSDFGVDKRGYGAGLKFGKAINENWDIQTGYTYARSRENNQRYQQETLGVDGLYLFSRKSFRERSTQHALRLFGDTDGFGNVIDDTQFGDTLG